jgi:hypothetical protein
MNIEATFSLGQEVYMLHNNRIRKFHIDAILKHYKSEVFGTPDVWPPTGELIISQHIMENQESYRITIDGVQKWYSAGKLFKTPDDAFFKFRDGFMKDKESGNL